MTSRLYNVLNPKFYRMFRTFDGDELLPVYCPYKWVDNYRKSSFGGVGWNTEVLL